MWADELGFGAFIAIWPVTLMINAAEWASFWVWAHAACVCLTKTVLVAMKSPNSLVSDCVLSLLLWELPAVIWKGFLCRNQDTMIHFEGSSQTCENRPCQDPANIAPGSAYGAGLQQVLGMFNTSHCFWVSCLPENAGAFISLALYSRGMVKKRDSDSALRGDSLAAQAADPCQGFLLLLVLLLYCPALSGSDLQSLSHG